LKPQGFAELPVAWEERERTTGLPPHHRDPFGRLVIAQAQIEDLTLLTGDESIKKYGVRVL